MREEIAEYTTRRKRRAPGMLFRGARRREKPGPDASKAEINEFHEAMENMRRILDATYRLPPIFADAVWSSPLSA